MTRRGRTVALAGIAVVGTGLALLAIERLRGGGSSGGGAVADATGFYRAGAPGPGPRGQVLASQAIAAPAGAPAGTQAWRVRYRTLDAAGQPVAATMAVAAPEGSAGAPRPLAVWVHGAVGVAPGCGPSRWGVDAPYAAQLLNAGVVVVSPDLTGLGVEGVTHPYLHGVTAGRSVLDAARAAPGLSDTGAGNVVALSGHSAGGHAALWANQLATGSDGDGLDVRLVVPVAPIGDLTVAMSHYATSTGNAAFPLQLVATWPGVETVDSAAVLSSDARERLGALDDQCLTGLLGHFGGDPARWLTAGELTSGEWGRVLAEQSAGRAAGAASTVVFQGGRDGAVLPAWSDALVANIQSAGGDAELRTYPTADHGSVICAARADVVTAIVNAVD